jgi:hypothetical protein
MQAILLEAIDNDKRCHALLTGPPFGARTKKLFRKLQDPAS